MNENTLTDLVNAASEIYMIWQEEHMNQKEFEESMEKLGDALREGGLF